MGSIQLRGKSRLAPETALEFSGLDAISSQVLTMRDVAYLSKPKASGDVRLPFKSSLFGMGVIDISEYGVRPVKNQDLSVLQEQVKSFVLHGEEKLPTPPLVTTKGNVYVCRRSQDEFRYLLKLDGPIEKGQTVEVRFPEVTQLLRSRFYRGTEFQGRNLIGEAVNLLSHDDLQSMLSFMEDELLSAIGYDELFAAAPGDSSDLHEKLKTACMARRRLHWVSIRIARALGEDAKISDKLYFGPLSLQEEHCKSHPASLLQLMGDAITREVKNEMLCALELDSVCGSSLRSSWCPLAQKSLDTFVDCILDYYTAGGTPNANDMLEKLKSCLTARLSEPITADRSSDFAFTSSFPDASLVKIGSRSVRDVMKGIRDGTSDSQGQPHDGATKLIVCKEQDEAKTNLEAETDGDQAKPRDAGLLLIRPVDEVKDLRKEINERWYRQLQWDITMMVILQAGSLLGSDERPKFMNDRILFELKQLAMKETGIDDLEDP